MKQYFLFDLDGTLTDSREGITRSFAFALEQLHRQAPPVSELKWCLGPPLHDSFFKVLNDRQLANLAVDHYRKRYLSKGMYENSVFDGVHETLSGLRAHGHNLYLATSKQKTIALDILNHFELTQYFSGFHGSESDGTLSDKGELISHLLQVEQLDANACIMIGDRKYDVVGAVKNKVKCIGAGWGYGSFEELTQAGAAAVLSQPMDLLSYLNTLN